MAKKAIDTGKETPAKKSAAKKTTATEKKVRAEKPAKKTASSTAKTSPTKASAKTMPASTNAVQVLSRFSDFDISLFKSGKHYKLYELMGSHVIEKDGVIGTYFAVWAPNAQYVSVIETEFQLLGPRHAPLFLSAGTLPVSGKRLYSACRRRRDL